MAAYKHCRDRMRWLCCVAKWERDSKGRTLTPIYYSILLSSMQTAASAIVKKSTILCTKSRCSLVVKTILSWLVGWSVVCSDRQINKRNVTIQIIRMGGQTNVYTFTLTHTLEQNWRRLPRLLWDYYYDNSATNVLIYGCLSLLSLWLLNCCFCIDFICGVIYIDYIQTNTVTEREREWVRER